jgi:hypothetical protein
MKKKVQKENNTIKEGDIIVSKTKRLFGLIKSTEVGIVVNDRVLVIKGKQQKIYNLGEFLEKGINEVYTPKKYYSKSEQSNLGSNFVKNRYTSLNDFINSIRPNTIGENEPIEANKYYKPVVFNNG